VSAVGVVSPLTPARSRVRGLAGPCIALTALTGAGMRPLRLLLRRFLGARAMRCRTALLSPPASASRVTAMGGVWTRPVAGAARFNTALSSPLSPLPSPSRPVVGGFSFVLRPHPRPDFRCVLGAFLRVLAPCTALCPIPHPVPRLIPRLSRPVPSRGSCLR